MIVVTFDLYLWLENTQIYPILYINNQMACIDSFTTAYTIENIITIIALLLQLSLRLYLRFVKKIKSSNEILSIKFILFLLFSTLSYFLPPPESSRTVFLNWVFLLQSFSPQYYLTILELISFSWINILKFTMPQQ